MKGDLEDRISMLSDDILISIISLLKMREAAKTSVLSHRWKYLWRHTSGSLDFTESNVNIDVVRAQEEQYLIQVLNFRFIKWVNLVLNLHKGSTIDEFRVCCNLGEGNADVINSWVNYALKRHVKILVLNLGNMASCANYTLKSHVFSNSSLGSLIALHLTYVEVTGEVLGSVLASSPLLQTLHVVSSFSLEELKIACPLPSLRRLKITHCFSMRCLEVHAINLLSFTYCGPKTHIFFKEIPRLVEADIDDNFITNVSCFSSCFSRLEILTLDLDYWDPSFFMMFKAFPKLPEFKELKQLTVIFSEIDVDDYLRYCTKLLKASPLLRKFVLKMCDIRGRVNFSSVFRSKVKYQHKQLKEIEFVGFLGYIQDVEVARRLLLKLPSLEKVFIDPHPPCLLRQREWDLRKAITKAQELRTWLPPGAELVMASHEKVKHKS